MSSNLLFYSSDTIDAVRQWKGELDAWLNEQSSRLPVVLFANKSDMLADGQASFVAGAQLEKVCRELGLHGWYATSAKSGLNISTGVMELASAIMQVSQLTCCCVEWGQCGELIGLLCGWQTGECLPIAAGIATSKSPLSTHDPSSSFQLHNEHAHIRPAPYGEYC